MDKYENNLVEEKFEKMGARALVTPFTTPVPRWGRWPSVNPPVTVDIRRDKRGEYFSVFHRPDVNVNVIDVRPGDRHLLLGVRERDGQSSRFLCGHDERSWFVAAVPESAHASSVKDAMDALKPPEVWKAIHEHGISRRDRDKRRTRAFVRQGEWFFIPRPRLAVDEKLVLKKEPIRRGAGKPHVCEFLYREGGQAVYVSAAFPNGLTSKQYRQLGSMEQARHKWRLMRRDARAYVKGYVRHPDHQTIWLDDWHQVVMNTETKSRAMRNVAFLD